MPSEVLAKLASGHIAPVVGYLLTDENTATGNVYVVGGGQMHRVRQFRSRGVAFAEVPTIDQVADRWTEIDDLAGAVPSTNPVG